MTSRIWLSSPHMSAAGHERRFVEEAFASNWVAPLGPNVDEFEREFATTVGAPHAAALVSGTAAIHMALKAAGIGKGDVVICQSLTFAASANPIIYEQAIPVFVDSDRTTWNMDPTALEAALQKYPQTKAVIVVHLYGLAADLDPIKDLCDRYGVTLIEDAAESLGTTYKGKPTGTSGEYGVFSFNGNKIITTSGGGMLISRNEERIKKVRFWATQARDPAPHYQHSELGYNYRMSNVSAGIGRGQLKVLDERVAKKRYIFGFYQRELTRLGGVSFMPTNSWSEPNCWLTCLILTSHVRPAYVMHALGQANIESRSIWKPMHLQPYYAGCDYIGGTISETLFENGLCLPSDTKMTDSDLRRVCTVVSGVWPS